MLQHIELVSILRRITRFGSRGLLKSGSTRGSGRWGEEAAYLQAAGPGSAAGLL